MNQPKFLIFKSFFIIFSLCVGLIKAELYPNAMSSGKLVNGNKEIPVKLFTTAYPPSFLQFVQIPHQDNVLIILNEELLTNTDSEILKLLQEQNYQFLDKNFEIFQPNSPIKSLKYLYHSNHVEQKIDTNQTTELNTTFKIWDPVKGLNLGVATLHFYSMMFLIAFGLGYYVMSKIFKIDDVPIKLLDPLFTWTLLGTILGARLGHVIFYQSELFHQDFWSVFLPIRTKPHFEFTGFSGLASHGATIALTFTTLYYSFKIIKKNPFWVYDRIGIVVALGGAFVRLGNFFNSEIIGKMVDENSPFAILFPQMSSEYGISVPRYPTQLFEAVGYFLLFVLLWLLYRYTNIKKRLGFLFGLFFVILWSIRFFVEFYKEPQGNEYITFAGFNTGQVLSIPFILIGFVIIFISGKFKESKSV